MEERFDLAPTGATCYMSVSGIHWNNRGFDLAPTGATCYIYIHRGNRGLRVLISPPPGPPATLVPRCHFSLSAF